MFPLLFSTILLDPPTALVLGAFLAVATFQSRKPVIPSALKKAINVGALAGALYALSVSWFFFRYPDWMFAYLLDTRQVPLTLAFAIFFFILTAFGATGALCISTLLERQRKWTALLVCLSFLANCGGIFYCQRDAYTHVGSFLEYHAHTAKPLVESSSMAIALPLTTGLTFLWMLTLLFWHRRSQSKFPHQPSAVR